MHLFKHEIKTEPGFLVAVDGELVNDRPLYVGGKQSIHFISFAPTFVQVSRKAFCHEGVPVEMTATLRLELNPNDLEEILLNAGHRTYKAPARVSAQTVAEQGKLSDSLAASLETFIRKSRFFDLLRKQQQTQIDLNQLLQKMCERPRLEVVSLEATPAQPDEKLLADLAARAGLSETVSDSARTRSYKEAELGAIVEYFLDANRQRELLKAQDGLAKAEGERAIVEAQQQIIKARTDLKIVEAEAEHRKTKRQVELDQEESTWTEAAMRRNATVKETNAAFEFEYKKKRAAEAKELSRNEADLAYAKEEAAATLRKGKRAELDELELYREQEFMRLRIEEKRQLNEALITVLQQVKEMPIPDYRGIGTLILGEGVSQDPMKSLVAALLTKLTEALVVIAAPPMTHKTQQSP